MFECNLNLRVHLVGWIFGMEKGRESYFLECLIGWVLKGKTSKTHVLLSKPTKIFFSQIKKKTREKTQNNSSMTMKMKMSMRAFHTSSFVFFFFFLVFFFLIYPSFNFFSFFSSFFFFFGFCLFLVLLIWIFFFYIAFLLVFILLFIFSICFGFFVHLFFGAKLLLFLFKYGHDNKFIQIIFFILSFFFSTKQKCFSFLYFFTSPTKHHEKKLKYFLFSHFFIPF